MLTSNSAKPCNENCIVERLETLISASVFCYTAGHNKPRCNNRHNRLTAKDSGNGTQGTQKTRQTSADLLMFISAVIVNFEGTAYNN